MAVAIEEPEYSVVANLQSVEIRQYEPVVQAVTELPGSSASSEGFRRLAGFIFGGNERGQEIAMTAPVEETLGTDRPTMAFTMPSEMEFEDIPRPENDAVVLRRVEERTVAVIGFSGWATAGAVRENQQKLMRVLETEGIEVIGPSSLNQYNPPWTLPFLRRNEIMVQVEPAS